MKLGDIYGSVLVLVLIGIILGVGITVLSNLATSAGLSSDAIVAINATSNGIDDFATWIPIIVVVIAAAIIIGLVTKSFGGGGR